MPAHNFCLRTDHADDDIDGGDQRFRFVAEAGLARRLLLRPVLLTKQR
jgi:hypothetical protein